MFQPQGNVTNTEVRNSTSSVYLVSSPAPSTTSKPTVLSSGSLASGSSESQVFAKRSGEIRSARESRRVEEELDALTAKESMEILQTMILGGKPGVDFPNYARAPRTKFNCRKMEYGGMFADPETGCQAYHVCYNRRKDTFLCPTGTLFNQQIMACDFWYNVNCETAVQYYDMNIPLYHPYQGRSNAITPGSQPIAPTRRPSVNRSDRPIGDSPSNNPVPSTSGPRPVFELSPTTRSGPNPPVATRKPTIVTIITLGSTPSTTSSPPTTPSTTTVRPYFTYSTTSQPPTVWTKKPTTSRVRIVTVPRNRPRTTPRPRPLPPGIEVDDRDWVFAWLKQANGTRADKGVLPENSVTLTSNSHKMTADNYPLFSLTGLESEKRKTETAFSFDQNLVRKPETRADQRIGTGSGAEARTSSAFDLGIDVKPYMLIKRRESELRGETASHSTLR